MDSVTWSGKQDAVTGQKSSGEVEKSTAEEMIYEHQVSCTNEMPETNTTTATMESLDASIVQIGAIVIDEVSMKYLKQFVKNELTIRCKLRWARFNQTVWYYTYRTIFFCLNITYYACF